MHELGFFPEIVVHSEICVRYEGSSDVPKSSVATSEYFHVFST